jgi:hypothetical protein
MMTSALISTKITIDAHTACGADFAFVRRRRLERDLVRLKRILRS